jgi:hypothetical protein
MRAMKTLLDRVRWVADRSGKVSDAETWSKSAGLSHGYISNFYDRAGRDASAGMRVDTLNKLADAAGISRRWLADGTGPIDSETPEEQDPKQLARTWFLLHAQRTPRTLAAAEEWLAVAIDEPLRRSEVWSPVDWFEHLWEGWTAHQAAAKGRTVGVFAASHDGSSFEQRKAASKAKRGE